jgi:hypothetical protein
MDAPHSMVAIHHDWLVWSAFNFPNSPWQFPERDQLTSRQVADGILIRIADIEKQNRFTRVQALLDLLYCLLLDHVNLR